MTAVTGRSTALAFALLKRILLMGASCLCACIMRPCAAWLVRTLLDARAGTVERPVSSAGGHVKQDFEPF